MSDHLESSALNRSDGLFTVPRFGTERPFEDFPAGSIIVGVGLTKRLFPFTSRPERFFWGVVLGPMASLWAAYIASRILGHLSYAMLVVLAILIWALVESFA
jgi:hypothetical protein